MFATGETATGLLSVPASGGEPKVLTRPEAAKGEADHLFPFVLPGGRGVLFAISTKGQGPENTQIAVLDLKTGQKKILIHGGGLAEYVNTGHMVYAAGGTLRAVPIRSSASGSPRGSCSGTGTGRHIRKRCCKFRFLEQRRASLCSRWYGRQRRDATIAGLG